MPYGRLAAFFFPWRDGAPPLLDPDGVNPFSGYPSLTYFWDTVSYTGLLPWISVALLFCCAARTKTDRLVTKNWSIYRRAGNRRHCAIAPVHPSSHSSNSRHNLP
jgi:hypothetical protein